MEQKCPEYPPKKAFWDLNGFGPEILEVSLFFGCCSWAEGLEFRGSGLMGRMLHEP